MEEAEDLWHAQRGSEATAEGGASPGILEVAAHTEAAEAAVALQAEALQAEVAEALQQAEEAQRLQGVQLAEHSKAREAAEAAAAAALERVAAMEKEAEEQRARAQSAGAEGESQAEGLREALRTAEGELASLRAAHEATLAKDHESSERLRLATAEAAEAAAAEEVARRHAAQLGQQLAALREEHAGLADAHRTLGQQCARLQQLEQQVQVRVEALERLGRELPEGPNAPAVPLAQHRELQLELGQLRERFGLLDHQHKSNQGLLEREHSDALRAAAHAQELSRAIEALQARLHAASKFQPASPPPPQQSQPQPQGHPAGGTAHSNAAGGSLGGLGGSLLASLGKGVQRATEISKSFVNDLVDMPQDSSGDTQERPAAKQLAHEMPMRGA
jgi:DNA repair exonuclease SbcCD ATPase subunit